MELLKHQEIASVTLFDLRLSESELMVYEGCIRYVLENCKDEDTLSELTGCESKEEFSWFQQELRTLLKKHVLPQYLPDTYKD